MGISMNWNQYVKNREGKYEFGEGRSCFNCDGNVGNYINI